MTSEAKTGAVPGSIMTSEIDEQPQVLARLLAEKADEIGRIGAEIARRDHRVVLFAARGTSDHAALYAKYLVEVHLALPAGLVSPSTSTVYGVRPDLHGVLYIAVSQSGGSPDLVDSLVAARSCGATTVAVTNNVASELARAAEFVVDVHAGPELAVAATKTYTAELLALFLLLAPLSSQLSAADATALAEAASATLEHTDAAAAVAARYRFASRLVVTARGFSYATAREGALKLMETSYLGAQAFSGADLLHGPLAMVSGDTPVIAVATPGRGGAAMGPVLTALRERGADLVLVGAHDELPAGTPPSSVLPVHTAGIREELHPILEILPLQRLALRLSLERGENPDAPRGLRKVTET
jgi:glutamine---fructose-6-phosphate transaminase (isomerizing)